MVYTYRNSVEHELDRLFPIEMLEGISIELRNFPKGARNVNYLLNEDGIITVDIKNNPRKRLKNVLHGAVLFSLENYGYVFGEDSVINRETESEIDDLVKKILSEPSSPIFMEVEYMLGDAEVAYIKRFGGDFKYTH